MNETTQQYEERPVPKSWNDFYNVLVIENPVGVGFGNIEDANVKRYKSFFHFIYLLFSFFQDITQNETRVAEHMLNALLNFYTNPVFSSFSSLKNTPLYLLGESYAGHYIPSMTDRILRYNAETTGFKLPLKGKDPIAVVIQLS